MWSAPANSKRVENTIAVRFWPTRSRYTFARFTSAREIAEFGPVAPAPVAASAAAGGAGPSLREGRETRLNSVPTKKPRREPGRVVRN